MILRLIRSKIFPFDVARKQLKLVRDSEKGATLSETLVAMAILMTVLVPVIGVLGILSGNHVVKDKIQALNYAQQTLENTLLHQSWSDSLYYPQTGWRVERTVLKDSSMVLIQIDVFRRDSFDPVLHLSTIRIDDQYEKSPNE